MPHSWSKAAPCMRLLKAPKLDSFLELLRQILCCQLQPDTDCSLTSVTSGDRLQYTMLIRECCLGILQISRSMRHIPRRLVHVDFYTTKDMFQKEDPVMIGFLGCSRPQYSIGTTRFIFEIIPWLARLLDVAPCRPVRICPLLQTIFPV